MSASSESDDMLSSALGARERGIATSLLSHVSLEPGATLKDGRYRLFRKLGQGSYASVWLAKDTLLERYVAIKIGLGWRLHEQERERWLLQQLRDYPLPSHPGQRHLAALLDDFHHRAPNVTHPCLVFEPFGRHLDGLVEAFQMNGREPYSFLKNVCIQALLAVSYLHHQNIMHGDIHARNLLLDLTYDINVEPEDEIRARDMTRNELNAPSYPFPLNDKTIIFPPFTTNARVVLVDLGCATTPADAWSDKYGYPIPYRAPEVVIRGEVNYKADIWALGCLIFYIMTGRHLFDVERWGDRVTNSEHMHEMIETLGPLPLSLRHSWSAADEHVDSDGQLLDPCLDFERPLSLADAIRVYKPKVMTGWELSAFIDFMSMMISLDPDERMSTEVLLDHRWVTGISFDM